MIDAWFPGRVSLHHLQMFLLLHRLLREEMLNNNNTSSSIVNLLHLWYPSASICCCSLVSNINNNRRFRLLPPSVARRCYKSIIITLEHSSSRLPRRFIRRGFLDTSCSGSTDESIFPFLITEFRSSSSVDLS